MAGKRAWMEAFAISCSGIAFTGMIGFAVAWGGLSKDVKNNTKAVQSIPKIQTDVELIKQSQVQTEKSVKEIKDAVKELVKQR